MACLALLVISAGWTLTAEWGRVMRMTAKTKNNDASERNDLPNYDVAVVGHGNSAAR